MSASSVTEEQATATHGLATIVNALGGVLRKPTRQNPELILPEIMKRGGTNAVSLTLAVDEGFTETAIAFSQLLSALASNPDTRLALTVEDIHEAKRLGQAAFIVNFQNTTSIEGNLDHLYLFYRLGLRVLQLTYQRRNLVGDGCGEPADAGLSLFGRELVAELNRLGILIDLSHCGYRTTMETIELSRAPCSFTHINVHSINPLPRNKTDEQMRAVSERGGVIGINSISRLLSPQGRQQGTSIEDFLGQIDYVVELVGVDHVGIGLDRVEDMTAEDMENRRKTFLTQYPELRAGGDFPFEHYYTRELSMANMLPVTRGLLARGYSEEDVLKILGANFLRLFEQVWQPAAR